MGDKPFKCPTCMHCFANSDHLAVHQLMHIKQHSLQVKIPGISDSVADQTPTPTRFLKTAEVDGSQLFEEVECNPFDLDFKLASKRQNSTVDQSAAVGSTGENVKRSRRTSPLSTPVPVIAGIVSSTSNSAHRLKAESESALLDSSATSVILPREHTTDNTVSVANSTLSVNDSIILPSCTALPTVTPALSTATTNTTVQAVLQQLQNQATAAPKAKETQIDTETSSDTVSSSAQKPTNQSQDILREQLKALIKSGQIKIQFTSDPSSPKVQATIIGSIASKSTIAPKTSTKVITSYSTPTATTITPMSVLSVPTSTIVSSNGIHDSTAVNLTLAKQKLKEAIQQNSSSNVENNNFMNGGRFTMTTSSSQGKYKDIILEDDWAKHESVDSKKRMQNSDEYNPDEKRRKFLERNRAAASRCRQKRKIWVDQLEKKSDDLAQTNSLLMNEISALRGEVAQLKGLLIAHKDCPVTLQQKALMGHITQGSAYVTVSDGQIIAIQQVPNGTTSQSAEEVASSALTDMATGGNRV